MADFINQEREEWRKDKVKEAQGSVEAKVVLEIPLAKMPRQDEQTGVTALFSKKILLGQ